MNGEKIPTTRARGRTLRRPQVLKDNEMPGSSIAKNNSDADTLSNSHFEELKIYIEKYTEEIRHRKQSEQCGYHTLGRGIKSDCSESSTFQERNPNRRVPIHGEDEVAFKNSSNDPVESNVHGFEQHKTVLPVGINKKGTTGNLIALQSNYFHLCSKTDWHIYKYAVDFLPATVNLGVRKALLNGHRETIGGFLYDGQNLYSSRLYPGNVLKLHSRSPSDDTLLIIVLKLKGEVPSSDPLNAHICSALVHKCLSSLKMQLIGPNYYNPAEKFRLDQSNTIEIWPGFIIRIEQYERDVLMCIEITHKVIRSKTVLELISSLRVLGLDKDQLQAEIQGLVVRTCYNTRCYRLSGIDFNNNPKSRFKLNSGETINFIQYYQQKYGTTIKQLQQPLLISTPRRNAENRNESVHLIPELCHITGVSLDPNDSYMIGPLFGLTNHNAQRHLKKVTRFCEKIMKSTSTTEILRNWNMNLNGKPVQFNGRVLPLEPVTVGGFSSENTELFTEFDGSDTMWRPVLNPVPLKFWAMFYPKEMEDVIQHFIPFMKLIASELGLKVYQPRLQQMPDDSIATYINSLDQFLANQPPPQIIVCVVTKCREERYRSIKQKCCVENGVPTQIITSKSLEGCRKVVPILKRLLHQINTKIGGVPWSLHIPLKGLMTVGIDVSPNLYRSSPPFIALVASLDGDFYKFFSDCDSYRTVEEMRTKICLMLNMALEKYKQHNEDRLPRYIILYRSGVERKQVDLVCRTEVNMIKATLTTTYNHESWRFAYILVSKREHTRIFSLNGLNPPLGTVVDDYITKSDRYDFFLVSEQTERFSAVPTLYIVISDNTGLVADRMHRLTYKLTHLYFNHKSTIRFPAPVKYAQRLARFTAQFLRQPPNPILCDKLYFL